MKVVVVGAWFPVKKYIFLAELAEAFEELGHTVSLVNTWELTRHPLYYWKTSLILSSLTPVKYYYRPRYLEVINRKIRHIVEEEKPDLILVQNGGSLTPDTIRWFRETRRTPVACIVLDDPTMAHLMPDFLPAIPHFTHLFCAAPSYVERVAICTTERIEYLPPGTSPQHYYPVDPATPGADFFRCNVGCVSTSYNGGPWGIYRALILRHVSDYGLRIFGDAGWKLIANKVPEIGPYIVPTGFLSFERMRFFFSNCAIVIGIGNPQGLHVVQQRHLDAMAAGAFQLILYGSRIRKEFPAGAVDTFSSIPELREKTACYLANPEERRRMANVARAHVLAHHTWKHRALTILEVVFGR